MAWRRRAGVDKISRARVDVLTAEMISGAAAKIGCSARDHAVVHAMPAGEAVRLLAALADAGVDTCVGGGWAVDALVGKQTRHHSDLDVWLPAEQAHEVFVALAGVDLDRIYPWPDDRPWNFVLHDGHQSRIDLHFVEKLPGGDWHYGPALGGETISASALDGAGAIAGRPVRCESPAWAVRCRTGYPPRPVDRHDVALLCAHFRLAVPPQFAAVEPDEGGTPLRSENAGTPGLGRGQDE